MATGDRKLLRMWERTKLRQMGERGGWDRAWIYENIKYITLVSLWWIYFTYIIHLCRHSKPHVPFAQDTNMPRSNRSIHYICMHVLLMMSGLAFLCFAVSVAALSRANCSAAVTYFTASNGVLKRRAFSLCFKESGYHLIISDIKKRAGLFYVRQRFIKQFGNHETFFWKSHKKGMFLCFSLFLERRRQLWKSP